MMPQFFDYLMFREGSIEDNSSDTPTVTMGSIVWGVILRTAIVILTTFIIGRRLELYQYWWYALFAIWLFVAFPAYRQYKKFNERIDELVEETLCGSCKYFNRGSQTCVLYDQHVSKNHIPCGGESWEPRDDLYRD